MNLEWTKLGAAIFVAALALGVRGADPGGDVAARFPRIREQLASDDFAVREAGQKELEKIPQAQVEALRGLWDAESDPEVKARLEERVTAMDLYALIHPGG